MTDSKASAAANKAHQLHQTLLLTGSKEREWSIQTAKALYYLRRYDLWRFSIGAGIDTWEDYLKQPEVGIPKSRADKLVRIYEFFVIRLRMLDIRVQKYPLYALDKIERSCPIEDEVRIADLLEAATELTPKDFKELFQDITVGPERTYTYIVMRKCNETGSLEKVHGIESKVIEELVT